MGFSGDAVTNAELLSWMSTFWPGCTQGAKIGRRPADQAKIVAELANGPTTPDAAVLYDGQHYVIQIFLCNAGGVTVSYFEQVQNAYGYLLGKAQVQALDDDHRVQAVAQTADDFTGIDNGWMASYVAVGRVAEACKLRVGVGNDEDPWSRSRFTGLPSEPPGCCDRWTGSRPPVKPRSALLRGARCGQIAHGTLQFIVHNDL